MRNKLILVLLTIILTILPTQFFATELETEIEKATVFGVRNYANSYYVNGENVTKDTYYAKLTEEIAKCGDISNVTYDDETSQAQYVYDNYVLQGYTPINDLEATRTAIKDFCKSTIGPEVMYIVTTSGIETTEVHQYTGEWTTLNQNYTVSEYVKNSIDYNAKVKGHGYSQVSIKAITLTRVVSQDALGYENANSYAQNIVSTVKSKDRYTQIKYVYDYLCNNISKKTGSIESSFNDAFVNKSADSNGYALAFQTCMEALNIPSYCLQECEGVWNVVQIDGKWYWVDAYSGDKGSSIDYKYLLCGTNVKQGTVNVSVSNTSYKSQGESVVTPTPSPKPSESENEQESNVPSPEPSESESEQENCPPSEEPSEMASETESTISSEDPSESESETENLLEEEDTSITEKTDTPKEPLPTNNTSALPFILVGTVGVAGIGGAGFFIWRKYRR